MNCPKHPQYRGKSKPRVKCEACTLIYEHEKILEENNILKHQIAETSKQKPVPLQQFFTSKIRIGYLTDTHLGSLYERLDFLNAAYKIFEREGITTVYHSGDIADGEKMYRGQEYELKIHGADNQVRHILETYPSIKGIKTYFITGNHDLSFWKTSGVDIGSKISLYRKDLIYLGAEEADIPIQNKNGEIILRLLHPGKGTAYAISYHPQKYIESLTGGEKPNIIFCGHYHKSEYLFYRNIHFVQGGTLQAQTPFMRRQNIAAMMGFWVITFSIHDNYITRFEQEFIPFFEKKEA